MSHDRPVSVRTALIGIILMVLGAVCGDHINADQSTIEESPTRPMSTVLDRNDLVYHVLPPRWDFGLPVGNGIVGGMIWVEDKSKVIVTLDHVFAWDLRQHPLEDPEAFRADNLAAHTGHLLRKDRLEDIKSGALPVEAGFVGDLLSPGERQRPAKMHVGRLVIDLGQQIVGSARLSLHDAQAELNVRTEAGEDARITIRAFATVPVIEIEHRPSELVAELRLERASSEQLLGVKAEEAEEWYRLPDEVRGTSGRIRWVRQAIPESPTLVLAVLPGGERSYVTVTTSHDSGDPVEEAIRLLRTASSEPDRLVREHREWWRDFWSRSAVQLPDPKIETLWYMGLYAIASSSREGGTAINLNSLWSIDGQMPRVLGEYIWDFYSQYWGVYASNHAELAGPYYEYFLSALPRLKQQTRAFYGWDGVWVPGTTAVDGTWIRGPWPHVFFWPGTSAWVSQAFWWHYLYTEDHEFLRETAYPFMRECMLFYEGFLKQDDQGTYYVAPTQSPETGGWGRNDTLSLSLIGYLGRSLLEAVDVLEIDEPHRESWEGIVANLSDYPTDDSGLMIREGVRYDRCHRHLSHLGPIFPGGDLTIEGSPEDRELIRRSVHNLILHGYGTYSGWSFVWGSIVASRIGRGEMAHWMLTQFADVYAGVNTFNQNMDWKRKGIANDLDTPCQDGNMGAVASVNEMLLQSWGGRVRVFPACPSHWREARFDRLLAEGGVEVSAVRSQGLTLGVRLQSASGRQVRLLNPFGEEGGYVNGRAVPPTSEGDLVVDLTGGEAVWVTARAEIDPAELREYRVEAAEQALNPYGLKYIDEAWLTGNP